MLARFVQSNRRVSRRFASYVNPRTGRIDGAKVFHSVLLGDYLRPGMRVLDVGGGKQPAIDRDRKQSLGLHVTGLDISADQLARAPQGSYDDTIVADINEVRLPETFDLIFSRSVLEHLVAPQVALRTMAAALKPGGGMLHLLPCRYAPFAIANRMLGWRLGRAVLYLVYPESRRAQGFRAFYQDCYPAAMARIGAELRLEVGRITPFFCSDYASFFLPFYVLDLLRQVLLLRLGAANLCENFLVAFEKPGAASLRRSDPAVRARA